MQVRYLQLIRAQVSFIPIRLEADLVEMGILRERGEAFGVELFPGMTEGVDDGVVAVEQPVAEMALPEVEPDAFDRIELGAVRVCPRSYWFLAEPS